MQPGARRGAAIGGAVGIVVGLMVGLGIATLGDDGDDGDERAQVPSVATSTSAVVAPASRIPAVVKIVTPPTDSLVANETVLNGTASGLADGYRLWIVVEVGNRFYAQDGPISVLPDGRWTAATFIGAPDDAGKAFTLYAASTGPIGTIQFADYLRHGRTTGQFPGIEREEIAADVAFLDFINVVRR